MVKLNTVLGIIILMKDFQYFGRIVYINTK
jgi:hypothetical protein